MSTTPILPHLFFRCRIVGGISADFLRTPSPEGGVGVSDALGVDTYRRSVPEVGGIPVALTDVALLTERLKVAHLHLPALGFRSDVVNMQPDAVLRLCSTGLACVLISLKYVIAETPRNLGLLASN